MKHKSVRNIAALLCISLLGMACSSTPQDPLKLFDTKWQSESVTTKGITAPMTDINLTIDKKGKVTLEGMGEPASAKLNAEQTKISGDGQSADIELVDGKLHVKLQENGEEITVICKQI